ncbi:MAG TPA: SpoIID/LytB domain-containing protein [Vicinamibacterales bacterium]|jgi:stage II sporulation protein D
MKRAGVFLVGVAATIAVTARLGVPGSAFSTPASQRAVVSRGDGFAFLAIDLRTRSPLDEVQASRLDRAVAPGSVIKIATLAAALESGLINERSGVTCTRDVVVDGHRLTCTHPDRHRPLLPADALSESCNVYVATIAKRLSRPAFDRALASLGLPLSDRRVPVSTAALGLEGVDLAPRALIEAVVRVAEEPTRLPWKTETLSVVRDGLRAAARTGTATALGARGIDALAKTGTTIGGSGGTQGLVVGVTPASKPTIGFVLLASGGAGIDAAGIAAERLAALPSIAAAAAKPLARAPALPAPAIAKPATAMPAAPTGAEPITTLRVGIARDGGYTVRQMGLEEYVAGVIAGEAARDSTPAALEALAIAVRTFAMANLGRHRGDKFDLCDTTHCQVLRKPTQATLHAAEATAGAILLDRGAPASIYFSASCGGHTERPSEVWPGAADPSYLPSKPDDACGGQPAWSADLSAGDLERALRSGGFKGRDLRDLRVSSRNDSGRVARLSVDGFSPDVISGQDLRTVVGRTLGWQFIKSTAFELRRTSSGFHFSGRGSGHGVGMCVIGAAQLGARGQSAAEILARYFPGLPISTRPVAPVITTADDVIVMLPAGDEGERDVIRDLATRSRNDLAKRLGVDRPSRITLRFHPSVEAYQRATGQPWFTAGATMKDEMDFVPLTVLRDRGVLARTVQHELVHLMTASALGGRPLWVREGAASFFASERADASDPAYRNRGACPTDQELTRPVSPGAMSLAYNRATACFARQIAAGRKWSEVR